jgi:hypothetical protein
MTYIPTNRIKPNNKVDLWDMGPKRPVAPEDPVEPDASKLKGADLAAAQVEHEDACERYKQQLRDFATAKRAHLDWHDAKGGPVKVELWAIDARHALEIEPDRYRIDLPRGVKPGKAQVDADALAAAEADERQRAKAADPQFGQGASAP